MTKSRNICAPLVALLALMLTPTHAMAARYSGWSRMLGDFFSDSNSGILAVILLLLAAVFLYVAIADPDDLHDEEDTQYLMRLLGRQGQRVLWFGIGIFLIGGAGKLMSSDSSVDLEMAMQKCGAPGTESFINESGFCDCPAGFTWADEEDETSVVCMVERKGAKGT